MRVLIKTCRQGEEQAGAGWGGVVWCGVAERGHNQGLL